MSPMVEKYFLLLSGKEQAEIVVRFIRRELYGNTWGYPHIMPHVLSEWEDYVGGKNSKELFMSYPDDITLYHIRGYLRERGRL